MEMERDENPKEQAQGLEQSVFCSPKKAVLKCKQKFHVAFTVLSFHMTREITQHSDGETVMKTRTLQRLSLISSDILICIKTAP
jgi:hypothetical protein